MKYLCLMSMDENAAGNVPREAIEKGIAECCAFFDWLKQRGHLIAHNLLQPTRTAKMVRMRKGKRVVTDGPFAETKEQLIGYFLIEARDLEEAIELAARFPGTQWGGVEVRPVQEAEGQ